MHKQIDKVRSEAESVRKIRMANDLREADRIQARTQISIEREEQKRKNFIEKEKQHVRMLEVKAQLASLKAQKGNDRRESRQRRER